MTDTLTNAEVDAGLDDVQRARELAMAQPRGVDRCLRLADLADVEASWWEALSEQSRTRAYWRAALAARQHALDTARRWRARADALRAAELQSAAVPESEAA